MEKEMESIGREIIVSKLGSSLIADRDEGLFQEDINNRVARIVEQDPEAGHFFVVSGAREVGMHQANKIYGTGSYEQFSDKVLAGMGATAVFAAFEEAARLINRASISYPITYHLLRGEGDPEAVQESESFFEVATGALNGGVLFFTNEGDVTNDKELMRQVFASEYEIDNDQLAAYAAIALGAIRLDEWKKEGGILGNNGVYIPEITTENIADVRSMLSERSNGEKGRGGPATTLEAAAEASRAGVEEVRILGVNDDMTGVNITRVMVG